MITTLEKLINSVEKFVDSAIASHFKATRESHYVNEVFILLIESASLCVSREKGPKIGIVRMH